MVYYTLEFKANEGLWLMWKNREKEDSFNFKCIFEGTKVECKKKLKELCKQKKNLK